jgi:two-component system sensor histidine kinase MprB
MTFRRRLVALAGLAVAIAVAAGSVAAYLLVRDSLRDRLDDELKRDAAETFAVPVTGGGGTKVKSGAPGTDRGHAALIPVGRGGGASGELRLFLPSSPIGGRSVYAQLVNTQGGVTGPRGREAQLGSRHAARAVARGSHEPFFSDVEVAGHELRVYTAPLEDGEAVQVARPLDDVNATLDDLEVILIAVSLAGIALAGLLGYIVSRWAITPVEKLRRAAEEVADTRDLTRRIAVEGSDELSGLARSFNQMLAALESAVDAQRQLVADASHELRTPLASVRTNVEVLAHSDLLTKEERDMLLRDVVEQLEELTELVGNLIDAARDDQYPHAAPVEIRLDAIAAGIAQATQARHPLLELELDIAPTLVRAPEGYLDRIVSNVIDNAVKWSPPGEKLEVSVREGVLSVRDHGPGIPDEDLPHVFDRFFRSASARGLPGSGLGLAIVKQLAEAAGGTVSAANAPGGGALIRVSLPRVEAREPARAADALLT